ncbi:MAG: alanine--tRNA ligase [Desulfovibrio sp.]|nr:alanine--tRNA ligase [Desulfovibrio sp.]
MLTAQEIRRRYLEFFKRHGHEIVASGPLIPPNDPTLLFTNAGMVQFKKLFLGEEKRSYSTAVTCQKCLRVSGKHNDLENVGRTARHHTFFEMLGNFSFGDYFKREAISMAWQFVTEELELPRDRLWVTVYRDDDEAAAIWQEVASIDPSRIVRLDEKDNFWTMGDTGPCGPCSEIYVDQGADMACGPDCGIGRCDCDRFLEIWNLVFTQFDQLAEGKRVPLAAPNIDTGMGLERIAAVCQGKRSNFDCDLFQDIIQYAAGLAGVTYSFSQPDSNDVDTALRVIADHSRSAAFLIAEGVLPSNEGRGYVLRRLIRRALRFATLMGVHEPFLHKTARKVTEIMGEAYPDLKDNADFIDRAVFEEEQRFSLTLENGLRLLEEELQHLNEAGQKLIPGEFCFKLYDTYGFPLDIVSDVSEKRGFSIDHAGFEAHMRAQRERAREHQKRGGLLGQDGAQGGAAFKGLAEAGVSSIFTGYAGLTAQSPLAALLDATGQPVEFLGQGQMGYAVAESTPFYGESGGQVGDAGSMTSTMGEARVRTAIKAAPDLTVHEIEVTRGELHRGDSVSLSVDADTRLATARNHTCTHLLHAALRRVLGTHVKQAGSLVDGQRLRFDFSHIAALTAEELAAVERDVNRAIMADVPVRAQEMPQADALAAGAMALFGEKYGDVVRVLTVGHEEQEPESVELCGGTHLERTGQAGAFFILSETGVAAGVRRIEAVTGWNAYSQAVSLRAEAATVASLLKSRPGQLAERTQALLADNKKLRKAAEKAAAAPASGGDMLQGVEDVNGISLLAVRLDNIPVKALREIMDDVRSRLSQKAVVCLATAEEGKVGLLLHVSKDLHGQFTAPALIKTVAAPCGGSGGGRPDLAQAGGSKPEGIAEAFTVLKQLIAQ